MRLSSSAIFDDLIEQVSGKEDVLRAYGAVIECVGHFYGATSGFFLEAKTLARLGQSGISLNFDFYHEEGRTGELPSGQ
jgi:hypothetical protein